MSLVGPSGCGKSTLLRLVARFVEPSAGALSVRARGLGYVFQEPTLLASRSVSENVELPAQLAGVPLLERRRRAAAVLARVGLLGFERHRPAECPRSCIRIYPQGVAVRAAELAGFRPCLKLLVPMFQEAELAYARAPEATNDALVRIARELGDGPPITPAGNANAVVVMQKLGIIGTGPSPALGDFDLPRVDRTIAALRPIFAARGDTVAADLKASEIVSNEFIDLERHP